MCHGRYEPRVGVKMALEKFYERWADQARPKVLPKERVERPDMGVERCIENLKSAGFGGKWALF